MYIQIKNINKSFNNRNVLNNINFSINKGEIIALMGASGSGKSTLLNLISGLDTATSGEILFENKNICKMKSKELANFRKENLGFIFQDYNLIETLTASENIAIALTMNKNLHTEIDEKISNIMKLLNISNLKDKLPSNLSGGEKQRIACARALIKNPTLILADEPTGALDSKSAELLLETFNNINKKLGTTIFMVTHDIFTASCCNKVLFLEMGKIEAIWEKQNMDKNEFFNYILQNLNEKRRK